MVPDLPRIEQQRASVTYYAQLKKWLQRAAKFTLAGGLIAALAIPAMVVPAFMLVSVIAFIGYLLFAAVVALATSDADSVIEQSCMKSSAEARWNLLTKPRDAWQNQIADLDQRIGKLDQYVRDHNARVSTQVKERIEQVKERIELRKTIEEAVRDGSPLGASLASNYEQREADRLRAEASRLAFEAELLDIASQQTLETNAAAREEARLRVCRDVAVKQLALSRHR